MLNEIIEFRIQLQVPVIQLINPSDLYGELSDRLGQEQIAAVQLDFMYWEQLNKTRILVQACLPSKAHLADATDVNAGSG